MRPTAPRIPAGCINWFQSTHSLRSATMTRTTWQRFYVRFQSTHSLRSATDEELGLIAALAVSIHALLAECDSTAPSPEPSENSFNPRTPCGVRLIQNTKLVDKVRFQSTHSLRSATGPAFFPSYYLRFQSTHSLRSATLFCGQSCAVGDSFNPRTPCGVRLLLALNCKCFMWFQSTHSLRSATR